MSSDASKNAEIQPESPADLLTVRELTCVRGGKTILEQIGFTIRKGDFASLVGPNGAGKSTLLKCLMGIFPVESGSIQLQGTDFFRLTARETARRVAYVPQAQSQNFPFTVQHFVEAARYAHQSPWDAASREDRQLCAQALEETGLKELANRELSTLSGGELQRVWLAGALAQNAELLLLDETTSQMDYRAREETNALLRRLNRERGRTILTVTHDLNEAARNADRILALRNGRLQFDGPTQNFLSANVLEPLYETRFWLIPAEGLRFPVILPKSADAR